MNIQDKLMHLAQEQMQVGQGGYFYPYPQVMSPQVIFYFIN